MTTEITRIDAHQHFWKLSRGDYGWLTADLAPLYRDFLPEDLTTTLLNNSVVGTVLVQAAPTVAETEFLLQLADENDFIKGVVGWVDMAAEDAAATIRRLAQNPKLVGIRPMIQDIADPDWMLKTELTPAIAEIETQGLAFDALTLPPHLPNLLTLLRRHPGLKTVVDHGSKPLIAQGILEPWDEQLAEIASETEAYCKLSGLVTEAADSWEVSDLRPYADHILLSFGVDRVIWGSDWPVCTLATSYSEWVRTSEDLLSELTDEARQKIFHDNAKAFYNI